jgi:hypothetical protein
VVVKILALSIVELKKRKNVSVRACLPVGKFTPSAGLAEVVSLSLSKTQSTIINIQ